MLVNLLLCFGVIPIGIARVVERGREEQDDKVAKLSYLN